MHTRLKKLNEGFTIVETLIVLAIAALILIIVLIAVPDLQRSARNSDTTTDAQNIASGVSSFEGNNDGQIPNGISEPAAGVGTITICDQATAANNCGGTPIGASATAHVQASENITPENASTATLGNATSTTDATIIVDFGASCPTDLPTINDTVGPALDGRAVAIIYEIETSSSAAAWNCTQE